MISPLARAIPALLGIAFPAIAETAPAAIEPTWHIRPTEFPPDRPILISQDASNRLQAFALILLKQCISDYPGNLALSPLAAAESCVRLNLKTTGRTPAPLDFEHRPNAHSNGILHIRPYVTLVDYTCTARLFVDEKFKLSASYLNTLSKNRQPEEIVTRIPFETDPEKAVTIINCTISQETKGRIPEALPEPALPTPASFMAVTAATFNTEWLHPFPAQKTTKKAFHPENGNTRQVATMHIRALLPCDLSSEYTALELPYVPAPRPDVSRIGTPPPRQTGSMIILMPPEDMPLDSFIQTLTVDKLAAIRTNLLNVKKEYGGMPVDLSLPKFRMETHIDLTPALAAAGMARQLSPRSIYADLFDGQAPSHLSGIWQACTLTVAERGTGTSEISLPETTEPDTAAGNLAETVPVEINRPFLWYIVPNEYHSRSPAIFIGVVREP